MKGSIARSVLGVVAAVGCVSIVGVSHAHGDVRGPLSALESQGTVGSADRDVLRDSGLRLAKGEAEEQYHPEEGESPESIKAKADALEAAKRARRGASLPPAADNALQAPGASGAENALHPHPQLGPDERVDERTHDTVLP